MKHSESIVKVAAALVAAQGELRAVSKDAKNPHFGNRYASLDGIVESVRPVLAGHKLAVIQGVTVPETNEKGALVGFAVETMLVHESGEWLSNIVTVPVVKADAQGAGGALTYGRRYGLSALLSLATEDDDDGNTASRAPKARQAAPRSAPSVPPSDAAPTPHGESVWPLGKKKGTPLSQLEEDDLRSGILWCLEHGGDEKYKDLIASCRAELRKREAAGEPVPA